MEGRLDIGVGEFMIQLDKISALDMTQFTSISEVMFSVCQPKQKRALFNMLRPFG